MRTSSYIIFALLCLLLLSGACSDSTKQIRMRNIELKQDIYSSGIIDISSKLTFPTAPTEINICFKPNTYWLGLGSAEKFGIKFSNQYGQYIEIGYDVYRQLFFIECRHSSSSEAFVDIPTQQYFINEADRLDMRIVLDTTTIALSSMDGAVELSNLYFFSAEFNKVELYAETGKVFVESISIKQIQQQSFD